jgi:hypothetical protein
VLLAVFLSVPALPERAFIPIVAWEIPGVYRANNAAIGARKQPLLSIAYPCALWSWP